MSAKPFWADFDDDDVVPIPGRPLRVGDIRGDRKREARAAVWLFLEFHAKKVMRAAYVSAMSESDETRIRMLTNATVRVGLAVLDKFEQVEDERREMATRARAAAIKAKQEARWGSAVRALLLEDGKRSAHRLAVLLRANKDVKHPPDKEEQSTFGRYVRKVKKEMNSSFA